MRDPAHVPELKKMRPPAWCTASVRGLIFVTSWSSIVLKVRDLGQTPAMTLGAAESGGQKCLNQFPGECVANYQPSKADHIQIVVLDALVR